MMLDSQAMLSDNQDMSTFTTAGSPWFTTNAYDLQTGSIVPQTAQFANISGQSYTATGLVRAPTRGQPIYVHAVIRTAVTSGGAATVQFKLISSTTVALTGSPITLVDSTAIAKATLVQGYWIRLGHILPPDITQRYIGVSFTVATADLTAGKIDIGFSLDKQTAPNWLTLS